MRQQRNDFPGSELIVEAGCEQRYGDDQDKGRPLATAGLAAFAGAAAGKIAEQLLLQIPARGGILILASMGVFLGWGIGWLWWRASSRRSG